MLCLVVVFEKSFMVFCNKEDYEEGLVLVVILLWWFWFDIYFD